VEEAAQKKKKREKDIMKIDKIFEKSTVRPPDSRRKRKKKGICPTSAGGIKKGRGGEVFCDREDEKGEDIAGVFYPRKKKRKEDRDLS